MQKSNMLTKFHGTPSALSVSIEIKILYMNILYHSSLSCFIWLVLSAELLHDHLALSLPVQTGLASAFSFKRDWIQNAAIVSRLISLMSQMWDDRSAYIHVWPAHTLPYLQFLEFWDKMTLLLVYFLSTKAEGFSFASCKLSSRSLQISPPIMVFVDSKNFCCCENVRCVPDHWTVFSLSILM